MNNNECIIVLLIYEIYIYFINRIKECLIFFQQQKTKN